MSSDARNVLPRPSGRGARSPAATSARRRTRSGASAAAAEQGPHHGRLVEPEQLVYDVPLDLAGAVRRSGGAGRATARCRSRRGPPGGCPVPGRRRGSRRRRRGRPGRGTSSGPPSSPWRSSSAGSRVCSARSTARRSTSAPDLEVGTGQGRAVDGGAEPAVARRTRRRSSRTSCSWPRRRITSRSRPPAGDPRR